MRLRALLTVDRAGQAITATPARPASAQTGEYWPAEVTYTQLSSGPHSANWTEIKGTGPATTRPDAIPGSHTERNDGPQPGTHRPGEHSQPKPEPGHDEPHEHPNRSHIYQTYNLG